MDLAFPELKAIDTLPSTFDEYTASISAVIPAIRPRLECIFYKPTQIQALVKHRDDVGRPAYYFSITAGDLTFEVGDFEVPNELHYNTTYIGQASAGLYDKPYNDLIYFWAKLDVSVNITLHHVAMLTCNMTLEALDVNTTFVGTTFDLNLNNLPQPLENTVRNTTLSNTYDSLEMNDVSYLAAINVDPQLLDPFFALLVSSPWAIPMSDLGDPSKDDDVIAAIQLHQRIIVTQRIALQLGPANETNTTLVGPIGPGDNDAQRIINATVTDTTSRRRIVQDAASTHILVALLAAALILFIIGWVTSPSANVLPREPTTIASVAALLAGGNIFDRLPRNTPPLTPEEAISALGGPDMQFRMGWGNAVGEEGREHGQENEAGVSRFGIFVVDKEEMD
ncbi:hypothetical protein EKO27_g2682 [Xylaria grammica]|uniref:Uncharacterized protein n=1 Tax=Xylaria grammica TaxID=363999 RepID=A0A439DDH2_9PEZI|nr:hypothetical protein EKO27_g2682 [Xylaria grammica]